ncbi:MAG TPA: DapH/DapD/GlmU-related protein [Chryseolinea sp.]
MKKFLFYIRFMLKGGYINAFKKLEFANTSWLGRSVSIFFEPGGDHRQRIALGKGVRVGNFSDLTVGLDNAIVLKDFTTLNTHCKIIGDVTIERYCLLSANIFISSGVHYATRYPHLLIRQQDERILSTAEGRQQHSKPVHIEEDVWIGFGVFIKQGITVGRGAVIGANAVVLKDVAPYEVMGGNPARKIKDRLVFNPPANMDAGREEDRPYFYRGFKHTQVDSANPSGRVGIWAQDEECTVAIPAVGLESMQISGFSISQQPLEVRIFIDGFDMGLHGIREKTFEWHVRPADPAFASRKVNRFSFVTFVVPYGRNENFGINTIKLAQTI